MQVANERLVGLHVNAELYLWQFIDDNAGRHSVSKDILEQSRDGRLEMNYRQARSLLFAIWRQGDQ